MQPTLWYRRHEPSDGRGLPLVQRRTPPCPSCTAIAPATARFSSEMSSPRRRLRELLSIVDTLVDVYGYDVVELIVSSPGGSALELSHVIEALQERREQGLRVRTRVDSCAQSAAALLVCAGDERIAEPGAQLRFHAVHAAPGHTVTAREASVLGRSLAGTDESVLEFLASRALLAPVTERAIGAEGSDRPVLEALARACARRKRRPRSIAALARLIAECVDSAIESDDRAALARIYRRLLAIDRPISARLALTLRLIDRVGTAPEDGCTPAAYPGPVVPEWARLFPPSGYFPRDELTRHVLALGEPGSGKTSSVMVPLLYPLADASLDNVSTALVVDPTGELTRLLAHFPAERPVVHLHPDTVVLDLMAGPRWSLDADLSDGWWLTAAHRILCRVAALVPESPARALRPHARTDAGRLDCEGHRARRSAPRLRVDDHRPGRARTGRLARRLPRGPALDGGAPRAGAGRRGVARAQRPGPHRLAPPEPAGRAAASRCPGDRHPGDRHPGDRPPGDQ